MRVNEFHRLVVETARSKLSPRWRRFGVQSRFTYVQLYFGKRSIHYEVWVRGKERLLEVGLHFESDRQTNAELLDYFRERAFEIKAELGDPVEVEQWTASWTRVHELVPYEHLDEATGRVIAERLVRMIEVLQPMLERAGARPARRPAKRSKAGS